MWQRFPVQLMRACSYDGTSSKSGRVVLVKQGIWRPRPTALSSISRHRFTPSPNVTWWECNKYQSASPLFRNLPCRRGETHSALRNGSYAPASVGRVQKVQHRPCLKLWRTNHTSYHIGIGMVRHVARIKTNGNAYKVLIRKSETTKSLEWNQPEWEDNIKLDLK